MDINFTNNNFVNFGVGHETQGAAPAAGGQKVAAEAAKPTPKDNATKLQQASLDALQESEPVTKVPDSALSRDDDLGRLVSAAFNLPPPPFPFAQ